MKKNVTKLRILNTYTISAEKDMTRNVDNSLIFGLICSVLFKATCKDLLLNKLN